MSKPSQGLVFRRVHGRVIPIRISVDLSKQDKRNAIVGGANIVGGTAIAGASGWIAKKIVQIPKLNLKIERLIFNRSNINKTGIGVQQSFKFYKSLGIKNAQASLARARWINGKTKFAAIGLGAAMVAYGARKAHKALRKNPSIPEEMAVDYTPALATFAWGTGYFGKEYFTRGAKGFVKSKPVKLFLSLLKRKML